MSEAERNLLSALLSPVGRTFPDIDITADDYSDARHGEIHEAAHRVASAGRPADPALVADALGAEGVKRLPGGVAYLHELAALSVFPAQATYFAEILAKEATRRRLKLTAGWLLEHADDDDPSATHDEVRSMLDRLPTVTNPVKRISDTLPATMELLSTEDGGYTPTGWVDLNHFIGGWRPGALYVGGARPGSGKSIIGAQAAFDVANTGHAVVICSMEMTDDELNTRLLAMRGTVSMDSLTRRRISDEEWTRIASAQGALMNLPIFTNDNASQTVADIKSYARSVQRRQPVGLVVVDYLQLVDPVPHMRRAPRHEQVSHVSRSLKLIAKDLGVPVLALAQLNRGSENRQDRHPTMSDLRESGAIEQDADVVLLLHREDEESPDLEIGVGKNRHGQRGGFNLTWQAKYARVANSTEPYGRHAS